MSASGIVRDRTPARSGTTVSERASGSCLAGTTASTTVATSPSTNSPIQMAGRVITSPRGAVDEELLATNPSMATRAMAAASNTPPQTQRYTSLGRLGGLTAAKPEAT